MLAWPNHTPAGLRLGVEYPPADEPLAIATIVAGIEAIQKRARARGGPMLRDAHARAQGCARGTLTVDAGLPADLAVGLFARPRSFPAIVRFSSSARVPASDLEPDGRGLAVKLVGVPGPKLLGDATTHDLVMINHPVFFVRNARDYVDFVRAEQQGSQLPFFLGLRWPTRLRLHELLTGYRITHHPLRNPLDTTFFSMSPSLIGAKSAPGAVKFSMTPCAARDEAPAPSGPDTLRTAIAARLAAGEGCFVLRLQRQVDPQAMPIEDPTIEWPEALSRWVPVGRLVIPRQPFGDAASLARCDALSFSPWHALPEHRPLGGINRVRRAVYLAISRLRHQDGGLPEVEPTRVEP